MMVHACIAHVVHLVFLSVEPHSSGMGKNNVMAYYVRFCGWVSTHTWFCWIGTPKRWCNAKLVPLPCHNWWLIECHPIFNSLQNFWNIFHYNPWNHHWKRENEILECYLLLIASYVFRFRLDNLLQFFKININLSRYGYIFT